MIAIKGLPARFALVSAPLLCLAAFLAGLPLPLPRWIFPANEIPAFGPGRTAEIAIAEASRYVRNGSITVLTDRPPSAAAFEAARKLYRERGVPVLFRDAGTETRSRGPLASWSMDYDSLAASLPLTLLFAPWVEDADALEIRTASSTLYSGVSGETGRPLLPPDRRVIVAIDAEGNADALVPVEISVTAGGNVSRSTLSVPAGGGLKPRILMVSDRLEQRSVIEALFPVRKVGLQDIGSSDPFGYELIVVDGLPLASLGAANARTIASVVERGAGSVLVAADSPDFGKAGDAPALERILPVDLAPRSLKNLPDLAMLILLDVSGSMFGDKLSLAKVGGIETLGNLKPGDLVGLMIFSEESRWLYRFESGGDIEATRDLAPLAAGGGTRMYPALREGLAELERAPMPVKHAVIISDGITEPADFGALAARARAAGITISTMAVGEDYDRELLSSLSSGTGGTLYRVRNVDQIPSLILEDRLNVSRTVFSEEPTRILGLSGWPAGTVSGMARFSARAHAIVPFSSVDGDPLLSSAQTAGRSALVFASDLYGRFTGDFFGEAASLGAFRSMITGLIREPGRGATIGETADGLHVTIRSEALVAPRFAVADPAGTIVAETDFSPVAPGYWSASAELPMDASYTALVLDRGGSVARIAVHSNSVVSGTTDGSWAASMAYSAPAFVLLRGWAPWLVAFFALSLAVTAYLRYRG